MSNQQHPPIQGFGITDQSDRTEDVIEGAPRVVVVDDDPGIRLLMRETLAEAGARYIQFDDTSIAFLCDPSLRDVVRAWGREPEDQLDEYAGRMNQVLDALPAGVTTTLHQCRGNREGMWAAEGGYDFVAERMFNELDVDVFFMEYDTPRAGDFAPLRHMPSDKSAVLGLISSKTPELEDIDELRQRIDDAAHYMPLDHLGISPQCGFASAVTGNPVTHEDQLAKLRLVAETADKVWG